MSHTLAELYAEPITVPSPIQLKGRMYYVTHEDEEKERRLEAQAIHDRMERRLDALRASGWRRVRRIFIDKEYRTRLVEVKIPVWLAVTLSLFGF